MVGKILGTLAFAPVADGEEQRSVPCHGDAGAEMLSRSGKPVHPEDLGHVRKRGSVFGQAGAGNRGAEATVVAGRVAQENRPAGGEIIGQRHIEQAALAGCRNVRQA